MQKFNLTLKKSFPSNISPALPGALWRGLCCWQAAMLPFASTPCLKGLQEELGLETAQEVKTHMVWAPSGNGHSQTLISVGLSLAVWHYWDGLGGKMEPLENCWLYKSCQTSDGDQLLWFPASLPASGAGATAVQLPAFLGGMGHLPAPQALFPWLAERQLESQTQQDSDNVEDQFWISHHELWHSWLEMLFESISRHDC